MLTSVKFCGLCREEDAAAAVAAGAAYAGVILSAAGPRARTPEQAAAILAAAAGALRVGVFVDEPVARVCDVASALSLDVVQLHGAEAPEHAETIRVAGPWRVWRAVRPQEAADLLAALRRWKDVVDGVLVDGWSPERAGGSGTPFPWSVLEAHRGRVPASLELVVAGGLRPDNVAEAVRRLRPAVVDVSSGVETAVGVKSEALMREFVERVRDAERRTFGGSGS